LLARLKPSRYTNQKLKKPVRLGSGTAVPCPENREISVGLDRLKHVTLFDRSG
jgi:hypothetical protein